MDRKEDEKRGGKGGKRKFKEDRRGEDEQRRVTKG